MRAQEAFNLSNKAAGTYPYSVQGGQYQLSAHAAWAGGSLTLKQALPDGSTFFPLYLKPDAYGATAPASTATASDLATAISDEPTTTTVATNVATLVSDGASPTQAHVTTLNTNWGTLKTAIDTWVTATNTFLSVGKAFMVAVAGFNVSGTDTVNNDIASLVVPDYTAFAAAVAQLVTDGASPTQAHVTTANTAWGILLTAINLLKTNLGTTSTDFTTFAALVPGSALQQVPNLAADGIGTVFLVPGQIELVFATGSALFASLARIPTE